MEEVVLCPCLSVSDRLGFCDARLRRRNPKLIVFQAAIKSFSLDPVTHQIPQRVSRLEV